MATVTATESGESTPESDGDGGGERAWTVVKAFGDHEWTLIERDGCLYRRDLSETGGGVEVDPQVLAAKIESGVVFVRGDEWRAALATIADHADGEPFQSVLNDGAGGQEGDGE